MSPARASAPKDGGAVLATLIGDVNALGRGEPQRIDTRALPAGKERDALLASGVDYYMTVPMIAGGNLSDGLSFGGGHDSFPEQQVTIALEVAISHERLYQKVQRLDLELEARVRELETVNKELDAFSYAVSHDLRAPLRAVDGYARMLEEDYGGKLDEEGWRLLGVVRDGAAHMGRLIDGLLKFSQVGRKALGAAPVDMRALAEATVAELAPAFPKARIELQAMPAAIGDRELLRLVWSNLVGNALKYSARRDDPRLEIGGGEKGGEAIYWVRDNGAGFDMRYHDKLFKVFQRLHGAKEFEGTGVGLAIVQRVAIRHGGHVWGEGSVGEGACFSFALPEGGPDHGRL